LIEQSSRMNGKVFYRSYKLPIIVFCGNVVSLESRCIIPVFIFCQIFKQPIALSDSFLIRIKRGFCHRFNDLQRLRIQSGRFSPPMVKLIFINENYGMEISFT
jgi:hypothetical protein